MAGVPDISLVMSSLYILLVDPSTLGDVPLWPLTETDEITRWANVS